MSASLTNCDCPCPDPTVVEVPGSPGENGTDGSDGAPGQNAYTELVSFLELQPAGFIPTVENSDWMAIGQVVFASDGIKQGHCEVTGIPTSTSVILNFLEYPGDSAIGDIVGAGGKITPAGVLSPVANPLPIADGGTGAATKAAAQASLGLGEDVTEDFDDALAYDITNAYATITGISVSVPATGLYKIEACVTVSYTGVTFASSRALSIRVRNTTSASTLSDKTVSTGIQTTTTFPAIDYTLPVKTATLTAADVIELQIQLDTVESAGSSVVTDAWVSITPLALS